MESLAVWFLGVIAVATLVQAGVSIGLMVSGLRMARRLAELQRRVESEIQPSLAHLNRMTRNAAEVSDLAVLEARRLDAVLADMAERLEDVSRITRKLLVRPLRPVAEVAALMRGLRRGLDVYHRLRHFERPGRHPHRDDRGDADDEHLFI